MSKLNRKTLFTCLIVLTLISVSLPLYPWGSFLGVQGAFVTDTHQVILREAFRLLMKDPGVRKTSGGIFLASGRVVGIEHILQYEGVYADLIAQEPYGPGPDAERSTKYSSHWFNPLGNNGRGAGGAPKAAMQHYRSYANSVTVANSNDEEGIKGMTWAAHFLADMFVPYHVVGFSATTALSRIRESAYQDPYFYMSKQEAGPLFLYSPTPPVPAEDGSLRIPQDVVSRWWQKGWGVNNDFHNAYYTFLKSFKAAGGNTPQNHLDWFDPWYWNGGYPLSNLNSSHATYESRAHDLWLSQSPPASGWNKENFYDPLWQNTAHDSLFQTNPLQNQILFVQSFTAQVALRTRQNIVRYWQTPTLAIQGAIEAVYTMWRSAFTAMRTEIEVQQDPERSGLFIRTAVLNKASEDCQNVTVRLTVHKGGSVFYQNFQQFNGSLNPNKFGVLEWFVEADPDESWGITAETLGRYFHTPDLQFTQALKYYKPDQVQSNPWVGNWRTKQLEGPIGFDRGWRTVSVIFKNNKYYLKDLEVSEIKEVQINGQKLTVRFSLPDGGYSSLEMTLSADGRSFTGKGYTNGELVGTFLGKRIDQ